MCRCVQAVVEQDPGDACSQYRIPITADETGFQAGGGSIAEI